MILWLVLFFIIVAISFLLAFQSMKDFSQKPSSSGIEYSLFLIRNPNNLSIDFLNNLHAELLKTGHTIALERLFKGTKSALVIFGPKTFLQKASEYLGLLELEEYSKVDPNYVSAWEVGTKDQLAFHLDDQNVFSSFPELKEGDQVWWQVILQASPSPLWPNSIKTKDFLSDPNMRAKIEEKNKQKAYNSQIRLVIFSTDQTRRTVLTEQLQNVGGKLIKLPRPFSSAQILKIFQDRSKLNFGENKLALTGDEVLKLSGVVPK